MATATAVPFKTSNERNEVAFGFKLSKGKDKDGNEITKKDAIVTTPEDAEKMEAAGEFEGTVVTTSVDYPSTFDDLVAMVNQDYFDEDGKKRDSAEVKDTFLKLFVAGAKIKVNNRRNALLTKTKEDGSLAFTEEQAPNGVLDLTVEISSGSKRVFLTEEQKTWKNLANLAPELRKSMFDVYLKSIGKEPGQYPAD